MLRCWSLAQTLKLRTRSTRTVCPALLHWIVWLLECTLMGAALMGAALPDTTELRECAETSLRKKPRGVTHVSNEDIAALVEQTMPPERFRQIVAHLAKCVQCRKAVSQIVLSQPVIDNPTDSSS
jgi:hypothetical protein